MKRSFTAELVAPCGLNCNVCSGFLAKHHDIKTKGIRMPYCTGCRPRNKQCAFLKQGCELLRNHTIQFCYECSKYPCERLCHIDKRYRTFFRMSLLGNLAEIESKGMKKFLKTQEEKWRCPTCKGFRCCHNGLCFQCDFEQLKKKKKLYRWEE